MVPYKPTEEQIRRTEEEIDKLTREEVRERLEKSLQLASKGSEKRRKDGRIRINGVPIDDLL